MKLLIRKALITDRNSTFHNQQKDILVVDGKIISIENEIKEDADTILENVTVSTGWIDSFSHFCDPGMEYRETIESGTEAAAAGGFTTVFLIPDTNPITDNKSQVEYIIAKQKNTPVNILPLGAVSKQQEGKQLAEMYDMQNSGAVAFSDGLKPVQNAGLLLKALQYVKTFNGTIIQLPVDKSISAHGLMSEGIISTQLGLPGIPHLSEELIIKRDIDLLAYTESKLHITGISSAESVRLIQEAKAKGLQITCSVTPYHLLYCDEDLQDYDTNLKTPTPLRTREDMMALRSATLNGTIDCIATHHIPQHIDNKDCEFEYAKAGMISLETAFSMVCMALPEISAERIAEIFSSKPAEIFGIENSKIEKGSSASFTIFDMNGEWEYNLKNKKSKSSNSPLLNKTLKGKVLGIVNKGTIILNK